MWGEPSPAVLSQVQPAFASSFFSGRQLAARAFVARAARPVLAPVRAAAVVEEEQEAERLRLNNLSPQPGARKNKNRKGRGYGAGQVRPGLRAAGACVGRALLVALYCCRCRCVAAAGAAAESSWVTSICV